VKRALEEQPECQPEPWSEESCEDDTSEPSCPNSRTSDDSGGSDSDEWECKAVRRKRYQVRYQEQWATCHRRAQRVETALVRAFPPATHRTTLRCTTRSFESPVVSLTVTAHHPYAQHPAERSWFIVVTPVAVSVLHPSSLPKWANHWAQDLVRDLLLAWLDRALLPELIRLVLDYSDHALLYQHLAPLLHVWADLGDP